MKFHSFRAAAAASVFFLAFSLIAQSAFAATVQISKDDYLSLPLSRGKENQLLLRLPAHGRNATIALDTGSPITCVDESKGRLFNLTPSSTANTPPLGVVVNGIRHRVAIVPLLMFGELQVRDIPVVLIDLSELNKVLRSRRDRANDAILGLDTMRALGAVIDCGSERLLLRAQSDNGALAAKLKRGGWHEVPMSMSEGHLVVSGAANGVPVQFIVDTGSPVSVLDHGFARNHRISLSDSSFALKAIHFETKGAKIGKVRDLKIGRMDLGQSLVAVFDVTTLLRSRSSNGSVPNGLLGSRTLARTQAFIDCENMKLYLKAPRSVSGWVF